MSQYKHVIILKLNLKEKNLSYERTILRLRLFLHSPALTNRLRPVHKYWCPPMTKRKKISHLSWAKEKELIVHIPTYIQYGNQMIHLCNVHSALNVKFTHLRAFMVSSVYWARIPALETWCPNTPPSSLPWFETVKNVNSLFPPKPNARPYP